MVQFSLASSFVGLLAAATFTTSVAQEVALSDLFASPAAISEYSAANTNEPCNEEGAVTLTDLCKGLTNDQEEFYVFCKALTDTNLVDLFADRSKKFTVFAPTNQAFAGLYTQLLRTTSIQNEKLAKILQYHIIDGKKLDTHELLCKSRLRSMWQGKKRFLPKILCRFDVTGAAASFIRGSHKFNRKMEVPQLREPSEPMKTCNANLFKIDQVLLFKEKNNNGGNKKKNKKKRKRRRKNKNKNNGNGNGNGNKNGNGNGNNNNKQQSVAAQVDEAV